MRQALNPPGSGAPLEPGIMEGSPPAADGSCLNLPITREEVLSALNALKNGKSSGVDGCPSELLRYAILSESDEPVPAEADVASHLVRLLNVVFGAGEVPVDWNAVLVSPIFKKGDKSDQSNYRPISVSIALEKLYATVLNARLVQWLEANDLRAPIQSGYRPHLGTEHQLFALRHLVEESRRKKSPLFVCFLDFVKAYDSVPRHLLWHIMREIGVPDQFLSAVQSMYVDVACQVRLNGLVGLSFHACKGVKQGCPLSPTLFGVFIDRFYFMLMHQSGGHIGPALRDGTRVPSLFYADDGTMIATKAEDLHSLCGFLDVFCKRSDMKVNLGPGKTEVMIFGVSDRRRSALMAAHSFRLAGQPVRYTAQYTYLGCKLHQRTLFGADFAKRGSQVLVKTMMLRRGLDNLGAARSVRLGFRLYDVQVRPTAGYGSCVWATRFHKADPKSRAVLND